MRTSGLWTAIAAALALALSGCAQEGTEGAKLAPGQKLQITKQVWGEYQDYVKVGRGLGPDRNGAFGVVLVGDLGIAGLYAYRYCPRDFDGCYPGGANGISRVLEACRRDKLDCLIFARNEDIQVPYEIID
ncbi:hypothetical protein [Dongia deserti]|uniref:hypothetical protein n=1 Tax=Dongia deserti TaxID=2268030 RepID=UPI0013C4EA18|nr:hypothetical protein [Dongia deserti]